MLRRTFVKSVATATGVLAAPTVALAQSTPGVATPAPEGTPAATPAPQTGYAPVNGLEMYYEIHGSDSPEGQPLVMLHGGLATIALGAPLMTALAGTRQVVAVEQQGHGHTADIDRPLTYEGMVEDTAALIRYLGIEGADVFGHSMGGTTGLGLAIRHPELVRKLVVASATFNNEGMRPQNLAGMQGMTPEGLAGTPLEAAYLEAAPNPGDWPTLLTKAGQLSRDFAGWPAEGIQSIAAPTLITLGDADGVHLDHAIELLRLLGGDVNGDFVGVPSSQLAVLPGTTHFSSLTRADLLLPIVTTFLDAAVPAAG